MSGDIYANLNSLILRSKSGSTTGQQNNTIIDGSINNITVARYGNVSQGAFSPYGNAGGSMYFDGSGDYLTTTSNVATALSNTDFTIEGWIYISAYPQANPNPISNWTGTWTGDCWSLHARHTSAGTDKFSFWVNNISSGSAILISTTTTRANRWFHVAITRSGSTMKMFVDGIQEATYNCGTTSVDNGTSKFINLGGYNSYNDAQFNGYLSDVRIIKGKALYTSDFAVPTTPLTAVTNTQLLLSGTNASIKDYTGKIVTETVGNVQVSTVTKKFTEGAMYFDGVGDYLTVPNNQLNLSSGDFTIEGWIYTTTLSNDAASCREVIQLTPNSNSSSYSGPRVAMSGGILKFWLSTTGSTWIDGLGHGTIALKTNEWTHFAFTRNGSMFSLFVNGVLSSSYSTSATLYAGTADTRIGNLLYSSAGCWQGYIDDLRVTKGIARYVSDFAVDTQVPTDPYANQSISIATSGINNGLNNTFIDSSSNNFSITKNGNVTQGTFSPFSNSGFSMYTTSSGYAYVASSGTAGQFANDFTVECWVNFSNYGSSETWIISSSQGAGWSIVPNSAGSIRAAIGNTSANNANIVGSTLPLNTWVHIAFVRSGSVCTLYMNGVSQGTYTYASALTAGGIYIGTPSSQVGNSIYGCTGHISDVRIVNGTAIYTTNFTPQTTTLTAIPNTTFLALQSNRFKDDSTNNFTITVGGTASIQAFSPFAPTAYSAATNGGSMYFDGTGDYLRISDVVGNLNFGSGNWTVEAWVYPVGGTGAAANPIFNRSVGGASSNSAYFMNFNTDSAGLYLSPGTNWVYNATVTGKNYKNAWHHVAWVRNGTLCSIYVDGTSVASVVVPEGWSLGSSTLDVEVGAQNAGTTINAYVSNLNVIKGTAKYTTNFTPPTAPLTPVANTQLLLNGTNATVYDNSGKVDIELLGTAKVSTTVKKYSSSIAFDGSAGCYAKIINNSLVGYGTGDFTIEFWVYKNTTSDMFFIDSRTGDPQSTVCLYYTAGTIRLYVSSADRITGGSIATGVWTHVALSRNSGITRLFLNGVQTGSNYADTTNYISQTTLIGIRSVDLVSSPLNGYIEDLRITKGIGRYATGFTVPATTLGAVTKTLPITDYAPTVYEAPNGDPYYNNVVLHMHMDGSNGSTNFVDQKGHALTVSGNAKLVTTEKKFGATSAYFDGAGDYLVVSSHADFTLGTGDFTIETWINVSVAATTTIFHPIFDGRAGVNGAYPYLLVMGAAPNTGKLAWYVNTTAVISDTNVLPLNTWHHVAVSRSSGSTRLFLNGVQVGNTWADNTNYLACTSGVSIGRNFDTSSVCTGYIDELRITKGIARYTSNFDAPTAAFPDHQEFAADPYIGQSVLIKPKTAVTPNYTKFVDSSNNVAIAGFGDTIQTTKSPYTVGGGSAYFDGIGDYLTTDRITLAGDCTIELWFYQTASSTSYVPIVNDTTDTYSFPIVIDYNGSSKSVGNVGFYTPNAATASTTNGTTFTKNTWTHIAFSRSGTNHRLFVNGVLVCSTTATAADIHINNIGRYNLSYEMIGYVSDVRVVGTALYTENFTPSTTPLTVIANTRLLASMDGTNTSSSVYHNNTIIDSSTNKFPITRVGNVAQGTFSPFSNGGWSGYFNNTPGDVVITPASSSLGLGLGTYTIEAWVYWIQKPSTPSGNASHVIVSQGNNNNNTMWALSLDNTGIISWGYTGAVASAGTKCMSNTWNHIAVTRDASNNERIFLNGLVINTRSNTTNFNSVSGYQTQIGAGYDTNYPSAYGVNSYGNSMFGYISNLRITTGTALYTSNFTPSKIPLSSVAGTQLLTMQDNRFKDKSTNDLSLTLVGNASIQSFSPFIKNYSASSNGGSLYFDGSGDYVTTPSDAAFTFGTGDFTIEFWVYTMSTGIQKGFLQTSTTPGGLTTGYTTGIVIVPDVGLSNQSLTNGLTANICGTTLNSNSQPLTRNTWHHIALTRQAGNAKLFVNGVLHASAAVTTSIPATYLCVGGYYDGNYLYQGYMSDLRVIKGTALYTASFTPPTAPLTPVANTQLLLNGTNSAIVDATGRVCLETGGAIKVDTVNKKYNTSFSFNGTTDYLKLSDSSIYAFGSGDFTVEMWVNFNTVTGSQTIIGKSDASASGFAPLVIQANTTSLVVYSTTASGSWNLANAVAIGTISAGVWYHIAVVRNGTNLVTYFNGVQVSTVAVAANSLYATNTPVVIGAANISGTMSQFFNGRIEDLRITKGIARYV